MQPVIRRSGFVHQMRVLSPEFPRYLSHSINIPSHAQCPEHDHRDVYGWTARNLQREPCISHDGRGKIAKLVVAWWSHGVSKPKKPTQDAPARTVTERQRVQHGSAQFTTVCGEVRGAAAGAAIGCSKSSPVFSHRPPASPRTVLRRPEQVCLREPQVQFPGLAWTGRV